MQGTQNESRQHEQVHWNASSTVPNLQRLPVLGGGSGGERIWLDRYLVICNRGVVNLGVVNGSLAFPLVASDAVLCRSDIARRRRSDADKHLSAMLFGGFVWSRLIILRAHCESVEVQ
ncbi:uncharacterized protein [Physcomitrium patens]|uniref:uncharacterized protein n=1 Tax=Physcomitrium patens TaxID=3218 RepID=UPI003CCD185F